MTALPGNYVTDEAKYAEEAAIITSRSYNAPQEITSAMKTIFVDKQQLQARVTNPSQDDT